MQHSAEMVRCLENSDVAGVRRLWKFVAPQYPQPTNDETATIVMHMARTQSRAISMKARLYSHRWLTERNRMSLLDEELRPKSERREPVIVGVVGVAMGGKSELARAIKPHVMGAVNDAILECYEERKTEPSYVKARMFEAKDYIMKKLIGRLSLPTLGK